MLDFFVCLILDKTLVKINAMMRQLIYTSILLVYVRLTVKYCGITANGREEKYFFNN